MHSLNSLTHVLYPSAQLSTPSTLTRCADGSIFVIISIRGTIPLVNLEQTFCPAVLHRLQSETRWLNPHTTLRQPRGSRFNYQHIKNGKSDVLPADKLEHRSISIEVQSPVPLHRLAFENASTCGWGKWKDYKRLQIKVNIWTWLLTDHQ